MLLGESVFSNISAASSDEFVLEAATKTTSDVSDEMYRSVFDVVSPEDLLSDQTVSAVSPVSLLPTAVDSMFDHPEEPMMAMPSGLPSWEPLFPQSSKTEESFGDGELLSLLDTVAPAAPEATTTTTSSALSPVAESAEEVESSSESLSSRAVSATPAPQPALSAVHVSPSVSEFASSLISPAASSRKRSRSETEEGSVSIVDGKKVKLDKFGCITYTRKHRSAPLPPVVAQGKDAVSQKRARNTEAARRSRARKTQRMSQLEQTCEALSQENELLKSEIESLRLQLAARK